MNAEKKKQLIDTLKLQGRIDDRGVFVFNNAKALPGGVYGMILVSIKEDTMYLSDTDMSGQVGELLAEVPMNQMKQVKYSNFPLNPYLKFVYQGETYALGGVGKEINALIDQYAK